MSDNVTWEPVAESTIIRWIGADGDGESEQLALQVCITRDGQQDIGVLAMHPPKRGDDLFHPSGALPADIRLCRAKPVQWSQEPPDAEGPLWVWHENENMAYPYAVGWQVHQGRYVFVLPNGETMELSGMPDGTWYMPATVPQPPRT